MHLIKLPYIYIYIYNIYIIYICIYVGLTDLCIPQTPILLHLPQILCSLPILLVVEQSGPKTYNSSLMSKLNIQSASQFIHIFSDLYKQVYGAYTLNFYITKVYACFILTYKRVITIDRPEKDNCLL